MLSSLMCLATAVYFEARGEPLEGQYAVAEVVINRSLDERFPNDLCDVVHEERAPGRCQFSFACEGDLSVDEPLAFVRATSVAAISLAADTDHVGQALYFHRDDIAPRWAREMEVEAQIGDHVFLTEEVTETDD